MEAKHAAAREIALAIGVPPMLLGIPGDSTYSNYQEEDCMNPDTALGLSAELRFLLKDGWTYNQEPERFKITPPSGIAKEANFDRLLREQVWRIAQFVAYANFVSISKSPDGSYVMNSHMPSGEGFEIVFETS